MRLQRWCVLLGGIGVLALLAGGIVAAFGNEALRGDINGDGQVDSADARLLWRYLDSGYILTEEQLTRADLSGNGIVNPLDAKLLWDVTIHGQDGSSSASVGSETQQQPDESYTEPTDETENDYSFDTTGDDEYIFSTTETTSTTTTVSSSATTASPSSGKPTSSSVKETTASSITGPTAQTPVRPAVVTTPPAHPTLRQSPVSESVYMRNIRIRAYWTGGEQMYDCSTKEGLHLGIAAVVKSELGNARNAENSTEAWKAQAVVAYTHVARTCYQEGSSPTVFSVPVQTPLNLNDANDKKIYNAVGEVLGIKVMIPSATGNLSRLCYGFYSARAAGSTASCHKVYVANLPYAQPVYSPETDTLVQYYDPSYGPLTHTYSYTFDEILSAVSAYMGETIYYDTREDAFSLYATEWDSAYMYRSNLYYYDSGKKVYIKGTQLRVALELSSHAILVTAQSGNRLTLQVQGRGHGVGLSQIGAVIYANEYGWTYDQILAHYFSMSPNSVYQICLPNW